MSLKLGKLLAIFIILVAISLLIAGIVAYPHLPFRHHPLFPLVVTLFVIADFLLIAASITCLRIVALSTFGTPLRSTAFLTQKISTISTDPKSGAFRKRAIYYDIQDDIQEIEKTQKEILSNKEELVTMLNLLQEKIAQNEQVELVKTQNLIEQIKQKIVLLEQKVEKHYSEKKLHHLEQDLNKIKINPKITKLKKDNKIFPKNDLVRIITTDQKIYAEILKDLKNFVKSIKSFLSIVTLELNGLIKKYAYKLKHGHLSKEKLNRAINFLHRAAQKNTQHKQHRTHANEKRLSHHVSKAAHRRT